ncbi:MAG: hypothetical protein KBG28_16555 [Kofleriaceae bacterium]|jgi:hypothetical protein|nr:hypothetical protein [Kofleriaceae bacterium]
MRGIALSLLFGVGCTRWTTTEVSGPVVQVSATPVGDPHWEETSTTSEVGLAGEQFVPTGDGGAVVLSAGERESSTTRRTRCVQKVMAEYERPVRTVATVTGRAQDLGAGVGLAIVGAVVALWGWSEHSDAIDTYQSDLDRHLRDPQLFPEPDPPASATPYYASGAGVGAIGLVSLGLSYRLLPRGRPPAPRERTERWRDEAYLDTTGCAPAPAAR